MSENLDDLIICRHCGTLHKRVKLPKGKIAKCSVCSEKLYSNSIESFKKSISYAITALILYIVANLYPIIKVYITGVESDLTIPAMIYTLFNEGFLVIGTIILVVLIIAPLTVLLSFILLGVISYFKIFKNLARFIISFLILSRNWAMVDIFFVSILVALVKLFGYARVTFGVSSIALLLFVLVDILTLKNIKPVELWNYFNRVYNEK